MGLAMAHAKVAPPAVAGVAIDRTGAAWAVVVVAWHCVDRGWLRCSLSYTIVDNATRRLGRGVVGEVMRAFDGDQRFRLDWIDIN